MNYKILFKTGDMHGAGTDADVSIVIFGSKLKTKEISLNKHKNENVFENNKIDTFYIDTKDLGEINELKIWHNNKWPGADWYLDYVTIEDLYSGKSYFFSVKKWIKGKNKYQFIPKNSATYTLEITTGTLPGSGTNSNVYLSIIGSKSYTGYINLKPYLKNKEFITGHTEVITLLNEDIGSIKKLSLKTDNAGFNSNFFLSRINIKKESNKNFISFPFFNWIKPDIIYPLDKDSVEYTLKIYTGDVLAGGTDANVSIILFGTKDKSKTISLNDLIARNAFEAGKIDYVKIVNKDLGNIKNIKIWHDEKWLGDGWFLNKITVMNEKSDDFGVFPFYSWLDKSENPNSVNIELTRMQVFTRPFYAIAHMVNTPAYAEEALDMGANAIEFDVTPNIDKKGIFSFDVFHGFRPDFDPDKINLMERSIARTDLTTYLSSLLQFEKKYKSFTLMIFDCKLGKVSKHKLKQCGIELGKKLVTDFYGIDNYQKRIYSIISVGKKKYSPFFNGLFSVIPKKYKKYIGLDLSEENFKTTEKTFEQRSENNFWWGSGIASTVPKPLKHFIPQFLIAAKKRTNRKIVKKIYYWTLDDPDSMERMLVTKLDGIIVNDPLKLLRVLEKEEFKHTYRLATREDDPFSVVVQ